MNQESKHLELDRGKMLLESMMLVSKVSIKRFEILTRKMLLQLVFLAAVNC